MQENTTSNPTNQDTTGSSNLLNSQNPQSDIGQSTVTPNQGADFQNAAGTDALNKANQQQSLQVVSTGAPAEKTPTAKQSQTGIAVASIIGFVAMMILAVIIYRFAKSIAKDAATNGTTDAASTPAAPRVAVKVASSASAGAKQPVEKAKTTPKKTPKNKAKRKTPAGRRRK